MMALAPPLEQVLALRLKAQVQGLPVERKTEEAEAIAKRILKAVLSSWASPFYSTLA